MCGWRWLFRCVSLQECVDGDGCLGVCVCKSAGFLSGVGTGRFVNGNSSLMYG